MMLLQIAPPDFSRGDWWIQLIIELLILFLVGRTRAEVRAFLNQHNDDSRN